MIRRVLIADDDPLARDFLAEVMLSKSIEPLVAQDAAEAFRLLTEHEVDLVLTDLRMPGDSGLVLLRRIRASGRDVPVVVLTAYGSVDTAVTALKEGADDFLTKPLAIEQIETVLRTIEARGAISADAPAEEALRCRDQAHAIVAKSPQVRALLDTAIRVARSKATVLITGESGTGKELFARIIHDESPRHGGPFVRVNCAALAETLLESELFGHEKGAFTGAMTRREGRFELADRGTIFLDEIGETSQALQAKLLRVLEEREFERVGGSKTLSVDVRTVAATNRDLAAEIKAGRFREDLFYRLQVVQLRLPPLRERRDDVIPLAEHFLERFARENGSRVRAFSKDAIERLRSYAWPGNVRELENTIERAVVLDPGAELKPEHLFLAATEQDDVRLDLSKHVGRTLDSIEKALILKTLECTGNSRKDAARLLGVTTRTLTNKISRYRKEGIVVGASQRSRVAGSIGGAP
jgi:DNA-binding NtrC family response regulator